MLSYLLSPPTSHSPSQVPIDNNLTAPGEDSSNVIHADVLMVEPPDGGFESARGNKTEGPKERGHPKAIDVEAFKVVNGQITVMP